MPRALTAVTAGEIIDWITTSPAAIRLTDSSKLPQNARKKPDCLILFMISKVLSISARLMLPMSTYLISPRACNAIAASVTPTIAREQSDDLPLYFGSSKSPQLVTLSAPPTRSGRMPSVSALNSVGSITSQSVGWPANFLPSGPVQNPALIGDMPMLGIGRPSGNLPSVNIDKVLSQSL